MLLKNKALFLIACLMFLGFIVTSYSSYFFARAYTVNQLENNDLPLASDNIYSEVKRDLLSPQLISSFMANDTFVHDWLNGSQDDLAAIQRYLSNIKSKYNAFTAFLVSEKTRNYYHDEGILTKISATAQRDNWYFRVRNMNQQSELNLDQDMANDGTLTIFINYKVLNADGLFLGATGVGLKIDQVQQALKRYREKYGNQVFFINIDGEIIVQDQSVNNLRGNIKNLEGLSVVANDILRSKGGDAQTYRYKAQDQMYLLNTRFIEEFGLILAVVGNVDEKTNEYIKSPLLNIVIWLMMTMGAMAILLLVINQLQSKLQNMAWYDALTNILNRQGLSLRYDEIANAKPQSVKPMSLLMFDVDNFKRINDEKGHIKGDLILKLIGENLTKLTRKDDVLARWGGEEFVMLLPQTQASQAYVVAEKIRQSIAESEQLSDLVGRKVTLSVGVAQQIRGQAMQENIEAADEFLYAAKRAGRNKVIWEGNKP